MNNIKTLILIPAYNEENNIKLVVDNIIQNYIQYDYLIVNDCSTDKTESICQDMKYNYISLPINLGIGGAVQSGYRYAFDKNYDIAVQLDGDGQHDPAYIEQLIQPIIDQKADMVIGSRFLCKEGFHSSSLRRLGICIIKHVIKLCCGIIINDTTSGFRAVNRKLIKLFSNEYANDYPEPEAIITAVLCGYTVKETLVLMNERISGKSSIDKVHSLYYMSKVPLALIIHRLSINRRKMKNI